MAANRIFIQVDFQTQSAGAAINALNENIKGIGEASQQATEKGTAGVKGFSVSVDQAARSLDGLAASVTGLGLARATQQLVVMGDQLNRIQRAFAALPGGTQALQELRKMADASRFSFEDLAASANQLRNFGVAIKDIPGVMQAFAGAVDNAAGNANDLTQAIHAFGQMTSQQFVNARSVYQSFGAVGLQIMQMLRDQTHKTVQQVREDTRLMNTDVLAQMIVIQARLKSLQEGAVGESVTARFGQLMSAINALAQELDRALGPSLGKVLGLVEALVRGVTELTKAFERLPEPIRDVVVGVGSLAALAGVAATAFAAWRSIAGVIGTVSTFLSGAAAATATVAAEAGTAATVLTGVISLGTGLGEILAIVTGIVGGIAILLSLGEKQKPQQPTRDARDQQIADLKGQLAELSKRLYAPDEKKAEEANKRAADLLDEAYRRNLIIGKESIEALTYAYREHFRSVAGYAQATAKVRMALEVDIATEGKKAAEERRKDSLKNTEELLALQRKTAITRVGLIPDETFAGRKEQLAETAHAWEEDIRRQTYILNQEYDRRAQLQIDALRKMGGHEEQIAGFQQRMAENRVEQNAIADEKVAEHRLQMEKETNALIEEQRKQLAQESLDDQIAMIEQSKNLRIAQLGAATPDSLPARLQQIRDVRAENIKAIQETRDARIAAAKAEFDHFSQEHPGSTSAIAEEYQKFTHFQIVTQREAEVQIQLDRFNLWKETNDAIIAEQRKVYEGIKSALDKVWDALLSRSQSVWAALGNALKSAILNAMKEIVTSRLAATIAGMFGYGTYTFKRGITGIYEPPTPSGAGPFSIPGVPAITSGMHTGGAERMVMDEINSLAQSPAAAQSRSQGGADRMADEGLPPAATGGGTAQTLATLRDKFNIGKPIYVPGGYMDAYGNRTPAGGMIPWSQATPMMRIGAILKSPAAGQIGLSAGTMLALAGLQSRSGIETIAGTTMAGISASMAFPEIFGDLGTVGGAVAGAGLGVGVGTAAYGLMRGGKAGLGLSIGGAALAGAAIGSIFPGIGTLVGAGVGAVVGAAAGLLRMAFPTVEERVRGEVKRIYGIDIADAGIRKQIADIVTQKYGGNLSVGLYSQDVQELVRLYAMTTGQSMGGLPRPMYGATFAQSQAGGLQLQPVYSGGQLIQNPYVGTTTTQMSNLQYQNNPAILLQLEAQQAMQLFQGQVVKVLGNNPGTVAKANATGVASGQSRLAQTTALMEPMTVTR